MAETLPPTDRGRLRRMRDLGTFELATIHAILDSQPLCTVAYIRDGKPYLTPTLQWREGDRVYWHGSSASHALRAGKGHDVCMNEVKATTILSLPITEGSAKIRSGPPRTNLKTMVCLSGPEWCQHPWHWGIPCPTRGTMSMPDHVKGVARFSRGS